MKIVLERPAFLTSLNMLSKNSRITNDSSGMNKYIRLNVSKKKIIMSSWNGLTMLTTWLTKGILECEGEGVVLIPFDKLYGVVAASSTKKITLEETEPTKFIIKANGRSSVNGILATEFPVVNTDGTLILETTIAKFVKRTAMVERCVAGDNGTQEALKAILWNGDFVATDGTKASIYLGKKIDNEFLLPRISVSLLIDLYKDAKESELKIYKGESTVIVFKGTNFVLTSSLINSKYPDYKVILNKTDKLDKKLEFKTSEMKDILNRCRVFEDKVLKVFKTVESVIALEIEGDKLRIKIGDEENHAEYVKSAKVVSKKDHKIYLKTSALRDMVELSDEDEMSIQYSNPREPVFVKQGKWVYFATTMRRDV